MWRQSSSGHTGNSRPAVDAVPMHFFTKMLTLGKELQQIPTYMWGIDSLQMAEYFQMSSLPTAQYPQELQAVSGL